ncbi:hypothetical protein CSB93_5008 [Pseudomonas paraeruginosa]|uniref:Uncharacterized protein n=1 Tax=Pseudomonas paraeruginosa TaxID=2994495 RepID=A0A2R3IMS0_9PSED|nr:hypothetical protein CSB93_5008 [Pseudomonas paraeruginosa]AWE92381.1 hypothetical protein CSC28_3799 [Pseudomonas paraeruginosa]
MFQGAGGDRAVQAIGRQDGRFRPFMRFGRRNAGHKKSAPEGASCGDGGISPASA